MAATVIDTLFGDLPVYAWPPGDDVTEFPWTAFVRARRDPNRAVELWRQIAASDVEPPHIAQAWYFLRTHGVRPPPEEARRVLGVVAELGLQHYRVDALAVSPDGSLRYYGDAGGRRALERPESEDAELVAALLAAATDVVARTGAWSGRVCAPLRQDEARVAFLTPAGLHYVFADDPLGDAARSAATLLVTRIAAEN